jgi:hypothetical protein
MPIYTQFHLFDTLVSEIGIRLKLLHLSGWGVVRFSWNTNESWEGWASAVNSLGR